MIRVWVPLLRNLGEGDKGARRSFLGRWPVGRDLKEMREACVFGEECARQREQPVQSLNVRGSQIRVRNWKEAAGVGGTWRGQTAMGVSSEKQAEAEPRVLCGMGICPRG